MFLKEKRFIQGMTPKEWELNLFKGGLKELSTSVCHPVRTIYIMSIYLFCNWKK